MMSAAERSRRRPTTITFLRPGPIGNEKKDNGSRSTRTSRAAACFAAGQRGEMAEVMNLLVKLGEIPPEDGDLDAAGSGFDSGELESCSGSSGVWPGMPYPLVLPVGQEKRGVEGSPRRIASRRENTAGRPAGGGRFAQWNDLQRRQSRQQRAGSRRAAPVRKSARATRPSANPARLGGSGARGG